MVREDGSVEQVLTRRAGARSLGSRPRVLLPTGAAKQGKAPASEDSQVAGVTGPWQSTQRCWQTAS